MAENNDLSDEQLYRDNDEDPSGLSVEVQKNSQKYTQKETNQNESVENEIQECRLVKSELLKQYHKLNKQIHLFDSSFKNLILRKKICQDQLKENYNFINKIGDMMNKLSDEHAKYVEHVQYQNEKIKFYEDKLDSLNSKVRQQEELLVSLKNDLKFRITEHGKLLQTMDNLKQWCEVYMNKEKEILHELEIETKRKENLEAELTDLNHVLEAKNVELQPAIIRNKELAIEISEKESNIQKAELEYARLIAENFNNNDLFTKKMNILNEAIRREEINEKTRHDFEENSRDKINLLKIEIERLTQIIEEQSKNMSQQEHEIDKIHNEINVVKDENNSFEKFVLDLNAQVEETKIYNSKLIAELKGNDTTYQQLNEKCALSKVNLESIKDEVNIKRKKCNEIKRSIIDRDNFLNGPDSVKKDSLKLLEGIVENQRNLKNMKQKLSEEEDLYSNYRNPNILLQTSSDEE